VGWLIWISSLFPFPPFSGPRQGARRLWNPRVRGRDRLSSLFLFFFSFPPFGLGLRLAKLVQGDASPPFHQARGAWSPRPFRSRGVLPFLPPLFPFFPFFCTFKRLPIRRGGSISEGLHSCRLFPPLPSRPEGYRYASFLSSFPFCMMAEVRETA